MWRERTVNVGGGRDVSLSLVETTALCAEATGNRVEIGAAEQDRPGDVRIYLSDCTRLFGMTDWRPSRDAATVIADTAEWIRANEALVVGALG